MLARDKNQAAYLSIRKRKQFHIFNRCQQMTSMLNDIAR